MAALFQATERSFGRDRPPKLQCSEVAAKGRIKARRILAALARFGEHAAAATGKRRAQGGACVLRKTHTPVAR